MVKTWLWLQWDFISSRSFYLTAYIFARPEEIPGALNHPKILLLKRWWFQLGYSKKPPNSISWREAVRTVESLGATFIRQESSHLQYKRVTKDGTYLITIPKYSEIYGDVLRSIIRQTGVSKKKFWMMYFGQPTPKETFSWFNTYIKSKHPNGAWTFIILMTFRPIRGRSCFLPPTKMGKVNGPRKNLRKSRSLRSLSAWSGNENRIKNKPSKTDKPWMAFVQLNKGDERSVSNYERQDNKTLECGGYQNPTLHSRNLAQWTPKGWFSL